MNDRRDVGGDAMKDEEVLSEITRLTDEERALESSHHQSALSADELARLEAIRVSLDQCWDLLRQRRARRDAGLDPDDAHIRPASTVEGYEQ
jgi:hypothetical protein